MVKGDGDDDDDEVLLSPTTVEDEEGSVRVAAVKSCVGNVVHTIVDTKSETGFLISGRILRQVPRDVDVRRESHDSVSRSLHNLAFALWRRCRSKNLLTPDYGGAFLPGFDPVGGDDGEDDDNDDLTSYVDHVTYVLGPGQVYMRERKEDSWQSEIGFPYEIFAHRAMASCAGTPGGSGCAGSSSPGRRCRRKVWK